MTKTKNLYHKLLVKVTPRLMKLYTFLARRTESKFNQVVLKRLNQSRVNRYPISVSRVAKNLNGKEGITAVCVCVVTDDKRMLVVPKMTVCALKFTESAKKRILAAGGQCITFDKLAQTSPTGNNTLLLRGPKHREALKYFGPAPSSKGSHTKIRLPSKKSRKRQSLHGLV